MTIRFASVSLTLTLLLTTPSPASAGGPESAHYGRGSAGIFWFMHLSDSHIGASILEGPDATTHFEFALNQGVTVIDPAFVIASGDLCDGSVNGIPASGQDQEEWNTYSGVYTQAGMTADFFFDLPGNHDGYGDVGLSYYLANSLQGKTNGTLFTDWVVQTPTGKEFYFFGLNSAGNGSGPFLEDPAFTPDEIAALTVGMQDHADAELTFVFAHHQLGYPDNSSYIVNAILDNGGAYYLHGHRHSYTEYLAGNAAIVVNEVGSIGKYDNNNIGVGVIDHNAFVYRAADVTAAWPLVIISAPVSIALRGDNTPHPYAYDVCKDRPDNPVRAEVFSIAQTSEVTVAVGGLPTIQMTLAPDSEVIWEAEVDTTSLAAGDHDVVVTATVAGEVVHETIHASFVEGPCDELPVEGLPAGGAGGEGGVGGQGLGGQGGAPGGSGGGDPGAPPATDSDGGCGCRQAGAPHRDLGATGLLLSMLALGRLRRRPA